MSDIDSSFSLIFRGCDYFIGYFDCEVFRCLVIIVYSITFNVMYIYVFNVIGICIFKKINFD